MTKQLDIEGESFAQDFPPDAATASRELAFRQRTGAKKWPCLILMVKSFQERVLKKPFPDRPKPFTQQQREELIVRLDEETAEFHDAVTLNDQADALVDLIYFALGGLHQMGVPTESVFHAVHHANIRKVAGKTKRNQDDDAAKPQDWSPPDHSWLDEQAAS